MFYLEAETAISYFLARKSFTSLAAFVAAIENIRKRSQLCRKGRKVNPNERLTANIHGKEHKNAPEIAAARGKKI